MADARSQFTTMREALDSVLINRSEEIRVMLLALASKNHIFGLGKPGGGKSFMFDEWRARTDSDVRMMKRLITKGMTEHGLTGPPSLPDLKAKREVYVTDGYLPDVHVFVGDEFFKGNTATINAGLTPLNERKFFNGGVEVDIPLMTAMLSSNEMPQQEHEELAAIFDRILFRIYFEDLVDVDDQRRLLTATFDKHPAVIMDLAGLMAAQAEVEAVPVDPDTIEAIIEIGAQLADAGIRMSGRRLRWTLSAIKANAWLEGDPVALRNHADVLIHTCWEHPDQRADVEKIVLGVAAPDQAKAVELVDEFAAVVALIAGAELTDSGSTDRTDECTKAFKAVERLAKKAIKLEARTTGRARDRVDDTVRRLDGLNEKLFALSAGYTSGIPSLVAKVRAELGVPA